MTRAVEVFAGSAVSRLVPPADTAWAEPGWTYTRERRARRAWGVRIGALFIGAVLTDSSLVGRRPGERR